MIDDTRNVKRNPVRFTSILEDNLEFILGIRPDMTPEQARLRLNEEYQKWNARVTHPDPHIQSQAEQMLRLIGQARNEYVTVE